LEFEFWLWACLHDAERYLESSREHQAALDRQLEVSQSPHSLQERVRERLEAQKMMTLKKCHFVMTIGSLLRHLHHLVPKFPGMKASYDAAEHLRKEGLYLRNMIEHADKNGRL
jgi:hypothetical protein